MLSLENFMEQLQREYCSKRDILKINNELQNLKKGNMSISEYVVAFIENIKLFSYLVPTILSKIDKFANGLPIDYGSKMKLATNLKETI